MTCQKTLKVDGRWVCKDCSAVIVARNFHKKPVRPAVRCMKCSAARDRKRRGIQGAASTAVNKAVRHGLMPHVTTLSCVDCGSQAQHYEHRDYTKPLDVQPVCMKCNFKRGPAAVWAPDVAFSS